MENNSKELWDNFKKTITEAVKETRPEILETAWNSNPERTQFYFDNLLPMVAKKMKLGYEKEKVFRVDAVFYKKAKNGYQVPIVFIESENNAYDTETEIYKLCCLNAPLKIIFICQVWTEAIKKEITEDYWNYIIEAFVEENILVGYLGVIVAEWMEEGLKFYTFAYNEKGKIVEEDIIVINNTQV